MTTSVKVRINSFSNIDTNDVARTYEAASLNAVNEQVEKIEKWLLDKAAKLGNPDSYGRSEWIRSDVAEELGKTVPNRPSSVKDYEDYDPKTVDPRHVDAKKWAEALQASGFSID